MKKETVTLSNIKQDMRLAAKHYLGDQLDRALNWESLYLDMFWAFGVGFGIYFESIWLGVVLSLPAVYGIVRKIIGLRQYMANKKRFNAALERWDICVTVEQLHHIGNVSEFVPKGIIKAARMGETVPGYCFVSGREWREPMLCRGGVPRRYYAAPNHYAWSKQYDLSPNGLSNISLEGDEYFYVFLRDCPDIAYIYPCKFFVLDSDMSSSNAL